MASATGQPQPEVDPDEQAGRFLAHLLAGNPAKRQRDAEWIARLHGIPEDDTAA